MRDALKHGKTSSQDDPSKNKKQYPWGESTKDREHKCGNPDANATADHPKVYKDAREWEGYDLNQAVDRGALTVEQAASIMRLRLAIGKRKACEVGLEDNDEQAGDDGGESEEELIEDRWQEDQAHEEKRQR